MPVPGFGYSFGDFATACVIINKVIQAFNKARGARAEYRESIDFLRAMHSVIKYIDNVKPDDPLLEDNEVQIQMLCEAYDNFHLYIMRYTKLNQGGHAGLRERASRILPTIRWSFSELNSKVQKMRTSALEAVTLMDTLILLTMSSKMSEMLEQGVQHERSLQATIQVMDDAEVLLHGLVRTSKQHQDRLEDLVQSDLYTREEALAKVQLQCEEIQASQRSLEQSLDRLGQHLEIQASLTDDSSHARELRIVARRRRGQSVSAFDLDRERETMDRMTTFTQRMGEATSSQRMWSVYERFDTTNHALETVHILHPMLALQNANFPGKRMLVRSCRSVKSKVSRLSRTQKILLAVVACVLWAILLYYFARGLRHGLRALNKTLKAFFRLTDARKNYVRSSGAVHVRVRGSRRV